MKREPKKIVVAGGGITGLSAAFYSARMFKEAGIPAEITVVEAADKLGGKIHTLQQEGFVLEKGPDSFLTRKTPILELTKELGLEAELTGQNPQGRKAYILHKGKLQPMPAGMVLGIPLDLEAFGETELVSPEGKRRALQDLEMPAQQVEGDESLGHFFERRFGPEVLANIGEPLLAGIYAGDTSRLSLLATFPQFREAERKHGSVIRGMQAARGGSTGLPQWLPETLQKSPFLSYRNGLQTLVDGLVGALEREGVRLQTGQRIEKIRKRESGAELQLSDGETLETDGLILTIPSFDAAKLLGSVPGAGNLAGIEYVSVANVLLGYDRDSVKMRFDGSGFLVPRNQGRTITACTWTSAKWLHTAPENKIVLRCYVGRYGEQEWTQLSDEELVARVKSDVQDLMGVEAEPIFREVTRLMRSMPQYPVGHLDRLAEVRKALASHLPGVYLAGAGYEGVGLSDCIRQAQDAAKALTKHVRQLSTPQLG